MTCERYWREGIVLVEHGEDDPHRNECSYCRRAHASRQELVDALPLVGAGYTGDPRWQTNVWRRIDASPARRSWHWQLTGALAAACVLLLWLGLGRSGDPEGERPRFNVTNGSIAMRSGPPLVGDTLHIAVDETYSVWIYRAGRLALQCSVHQIASGCVRDEYGLTVAFPLSSAAEYQVLAVESATDSPLEAFDPQERALKDKGVHPVEMFYEVR